MCQTIVTVWLSESVASCKVNISSDFAQLILSVYAKTYIIPETRNDIHDVVLRNLTFEHS